MFRPRKAARRARQHRARRHTDGLDDGGDSAVRQRDERRAAISGVAKAGLKLAQIAFQNRSHIGVHSCRRDPLVLLDMGQHLGGKRHVNVGEGLCQAGARFLLMGCVRIGVQIADSDGFNIGRLQDGDRSLQGGDVERCFDRAGMAHAFPHADAKIARDEGRLARQAQIVALRLQSFPHLQDVAMPLSGEQADPGAFALK